jgi:hypothetical protein
MFQNGLYSLKCFVLVLNLCLMFQNDPYPLRRFILVLTHLSLCKKMY